MNDAIHFPIDLLNMVQSRLHQLLRSYVDAGHIPRCLLAFADGDRLDIRPELITDQNWKVTIVRSEIGLIGEVLRTQKRRIWPSKGVISYHDADEKTVFEIAEPIFYNGKITAVLLIDFFRDERSENFKTYRLSRWKEEIERALLSAEEAHNEIEKDIRRITEIVVEETESTRGYCAVVLWDGTVRYFVAGENTEEFKYLSQLEGLCGEVLRIGEFVNEPNVAESTTYRAFDLEIASEAVAPILFGGEVIGVLNMESLARGHYSEDRVELIKSISDELSELAASIRTPPGGGISRHSSLLSDLVEKFSVDNAVLSEELESRQVRNWARGLCKAKVMALRDVLDVEFEDTEPVTSDVGEPVRVYRKAIDVPNQPLIEETGEGTWRGYFDMLREAVVVAKLKVVFSTKPDLATSQIIGQFCRLTGNEIRRRTAELGSSEFEQLVTYIGRLSADELMARVPLCIRRMMDCDEVTFLDVERHGDGSERLRVWQTTALDWRTNTDEPFYRVAIDDGLTGYAGTRIDVLVIRNVMDADELNSIHPGLQWKRKIGEGSGPLARSFFAVPIRRANGLVGVLRGHRNVKSGGFAFSDQDLSRLRLVQLLLERAFAGDGEPLGPPQNLQPGFAEG